MTSLLTRPVSHLISSRTPQIWNHFVRRNAVPNGRIACWTETARLTTSVATTTTTTTIHESSQSSSSSEDEQGPGGDLFLARVGPELLAKSAWVRRTFEPRSNSSSLLACGGEALAKHASFDPEYNRARDWIRHHAVGPAVLSPVLINGLVGALVEASVPQSIPVSSSMQQIRPLIVGVSLCLCVRVCVCVRCIVSEIHVPLLTMFVDNRVVAGRSKYVPGLK